MMDKQKRKISEQHLKSGNLSALFNSIGWDNPTSEQTETVICENQKFSLLPVAEKKGVVIFQCKDIPDAKLRRKIESQVKNIKHEHLIVFVSSDKSKQVWQWVAREKGKPDKFKEHQWQTDRSPEPLIQKLKNVTFSLKDEYELPFLGVLERLQSAFDQERVTKKFYDTFKKEHEKFKEFIEGLTEDTDKELYASLMLNRLMFVYFIQKREFLDGDIHYLKNRLDVVRKNKGPDKFYGFYKEFLLELFHRGLATPKDLRDEETIKLIGNIPYLNGGLFEPHVFEEEDSEIQIADEAFERIFSFFEKFEWALDTRLTEKADGNQINPDILGHIFEKFINQKDMGAYYTKEDITGYITQNTVIPWLFRKVESNDKGWFASDGCVWEQLREAPEKYIYKEVAHGTDFEIPKSISAGIKDASKRGDWNKEASKEHGLPTEIWRETVERRQRHSDIRERIISGEITKIEDLITYNLNISQFAQDVIRNANSPDLVRAFWDGIKDIKILDPACGSGAFLFAALNVLHDLYDACLERMEQFIEEPSKSKDINYNISDFEKVLKQVEDRNRSYFIYKEIILYNLYGVDIMNDAVEICKLRLFLKLASELKQDEDVEALPDIDFNIRAGNSLIGYTSAADMENAIKAGTEKLDFDDRSAKIKNTVEELAKAFDKFRKKQMKLGGKIGAEDKKNLRDKLKKFTDELDIFLSQDYEIKSDEFENWRDEVKPFHWWAEFHDIVDRGRTGEGGFDVIIGNPPYMEASRVGYSPIEFKTKGTVQGYFIEQSAKLLSQDGGMSMIVPMSLTSTKRMKDVQDIIETNRSTWYSNFSKRPAKLFDGVELAALSIFISLPSLEKGVFTTGYKMWFAEARETLLPTINYIKLPKLRSSFWVPKFQDSIELSIFDKVQYQKVSIAELLLKLPKAKARKRRVGSVYYRTAGGGNWRVFTNFAPEFHSENDIENAAEKILSLKKNYNPAVLVAILSSNIFWWWYVIGSDCWNLPPAYIHNFKVNPDVFSDNEILALGNKYLVDIKKNSRCQKIRLATGTVKAQVFSIQKSKPIIDKIDEVLSRYYGFTAEEIDFIQNYDIKFRVGADANED